MEKLKKLWVPLTIAVFFVVSIAFWGRAAITQISGLAVAQSSTKWNNVADSAIGDAQASGILASGLYGFNGVNFDRIRGDTANGLDVDVTRVTGTVTVSPLSSGTAFYAIKRADIAAVSANLAFGFTSKKVAIETDPSNTDEVCIDWIGGAAVCPAANTAGDSRLAAGRTIILDEYAVTSISVIASSGTQTVYVRAWN